MRTALIALSALVLATGAQAKTTTPETQQLSIKYADLNLSSASGQKRLESRIEVAVRDICDADYVPTGTRIKPASIDTCMETARASAKRQMAAVIQRDYQLGG